MVASIFTMSQEELFQHSAIRVHFGKTKLWNQGGVVPSGYGVLRVAMDTEDNQFLVDVLERDSDTDSLEVHSTQSQALDDSEHEDNCSEAGSEVLPPAELKPDPPLMRPSVAAMRAGLPLLDGEDLSQMFSHRAAVMKAVPKFLWGSFRIALKLAFVEVAAGSAANDRLRQERGWKLFLILPRMLLHRPLRGGLLGKEKLLARVEKFAAGQWTDLLSVSDFCSEQAAVVSRRLGRRQEFGFDKRVSRALHLVQLGELSSGRQALEGADLAPGTTATLNALRDRTVFPDFARTFHGFHPTDHSNWTKCCSLAICDRQREVHRERHGSICDHCLILPGTVASSLEW